MQADVGFDVDRVGRRVLAGPNHAVGQVVDRHAVRQVGGIIGVRIGAYFWVLGEGRLYLGDHLLDVVDGDEVAARPADGNVEELTAGGQRQREVVREAIGDAPRRRDKTAYTEAVGAAGVHLREESEGIANNADVAPGGVGGVHLGVVLLFAVDQLFKTGHEGVSEIGRDHHGLSIVDAETAFEIGEAERDVLPDQPFAGPGVAFQQADAGGITEPVGEHHPLGLPGLARNGRDAVRFGANVNGLHLQERQALRHF